MLHKKDLSIFIIYGLVIFSALLLFFTVINPLVVYDADDWMYIYTLRKPIPMMHVWNPTKVFPETAMPAVSYFGAFVINPIINNYCHSLTLAHGLFASMLLTIYFVQFPVMFYKRNFATAKRSIVYGCLFFLLHFISHIFKGTDNAFLIGSINITCFYNYVLAAVLNAILVMHFISYGGIKKWYQCSNLLHKLVVLIWTYFALNSNLYSSVIMATYVGSELFLNLVNEKKENNFKIKDYLLNNWPNILLIFWWLTTNVLETTGGRAGDMHKSVLANLPIVIFYAVVSVLGKNVFITILDVVVFVLWYRLHGKKITSTAVRFIAFIGFQLLYLILLSAAVEPTYIYRSEVTICTFFYLFMAMIACLNELIKTDKKYKRLPMILAGTVLLLLIHPGRVLMPYNYSYLTYNQCEALMDDMITQFKVAEAQGKDEIVLEVPKFDSENNWPYCEFIGERMEEAFYRHNIIDSEIEVKEVKLSEEKTKEFGINPAR